MRLVHRLFLLTSLATVPLLSLNACSSTSNSGTSSPKTLVSVAPMTLQTGSAVCGDVDGSWRTYVATLTDVTDPNNPVVLPSSGPVACGMPVAFARVEAGHAYLADIAAYDRDDIEPAGGPSSGAQKMVARSSGEEVAPRWTTTCGQMPTPLENPVEAGPAFDYSDVAAVSRYGLNAIVSHCQPLEEKGSASPTRLTLDLSTTLGGMSCETSIDHFEVESTSLAFTAAGCGDKLTFDDVTADKRYEAVVHAFEPGKTQPSWATTCSALARAGLSIPMQCLPLSDRGAIAVDGTALQKQAGVSCVHVRAVLVGSTKAPVEAACADDVAFRNLTPGAYQMTVDATDGEEKEVFSAFCKGVVRPGTTSLASCIVGK